MNELNYEKWTAQLNTVFRLPELTPPLELKLIGITEPVITPRQEMFSLFFLGPNDLFLEQHTYEFAHEHVGTGSLFIVPVGQSESGITYEAAFNRLVAPES
jgi:hypothetical protein